MDRKERTVRKILRKEKGIIISDNEPLSEIVKKCHSNCGEICWGTKGVIPRTGFRLNELCGKNIKSV